MYPVSICASGIVYKKGWTQVLKNQLMFYFVKKSVMLRGKLILFFLPVLQVLLLQGQCVDARYPFRAGERLTYEVAYNWGLLWVDAGEVEFRADTVESDGETLFYFDSRGNSFKVYDLFYKVRDRFQSMVKPTGFAPVWFRRETYEGGYIVDNTYAYDWARGRVVSTTENSNKPKTVDTLEIEPCTYDVLSAIYYARTFDFEKHEPGDKIPIRFLIDGGFYDLYIRYLGKEVVVNRSGKEYLCHKFSALLVEGTIFAGGEDLVVWVSADKNKVPVMVEARILIGSVKAYLTGWENLVMDLEAME